MGQRNNQQNVPFGVSWGYMRHLYILIPVFSSVNVYVLNFKYVNMFARLSSINEINVTLHVGLMYILFNYRNPNCSMDDINKVFNINIRQAMTVIPSDVACTKLNARKMLQRTQYIYTIKEHGSISRVRTRLISSQTRDKTSPNSTDCLLLLTRLNVLPIFGRPCLQVPLFSKQEKSKPELQAEQSGSLLFKNICIYHFNWIQGTIQRWRQHHNLQLFLMGNFNGSLDMFVLWNHRYTEAMRLASSLLRSASTNQKAL